MRSNRYVDLWDSERVLCKRSVKTDKNINLTKKRKKRGEMTAGS
jgi:hypothetical protein